MSSYQLDAKQVAELCTVHHRTRDAASADCIKAVILLAKGWIPINVAEALMVTERTVRTYFQTYQREEIDGLLFRVYVGKEPYLTSEKQEELAEYIDVNLITTIKEIVAYVYEKFGVQYSLSGMTKLVRRLNFVYKKTSHIPAKVDSEAQHKFVESYREIRETYDEVYFADGCHPTHNSVPSYAWIRKGKGKDLKANPGLRRLNINGALNIKSRNMEVFYSERINAQSTMTLLKK